MLFDKKSSSDFESKLLLNLLDHSTEGIIIAGGAFPKVLYANQTVQKIFGYSANELLKFSPSQIMGLIHPDDKEDFFTRYKRRLAGMDIPTKQKVRGVDKNKETHWIEYSSHRITFKGEYAIQINFIDATKYHDLLDIQKNAFNERNKILENVNESIIILDTKYRINWVNKSFENLSSLKRDDIINDSVVSIFVKNILPSYQFALLSMTKDVLIGKEIKDKELMINYNNNILTISVNIGYVRDDNDRTKYIICSVKDISLDKKNVDDLSDRISLINSIMPATHYGLLVVDNHKIVFVNDTFFTMWKVPKKLHKNTDDEVLLSHAINELISPEEFIKKVQHIYTHPNEDSQDYIYFKDGRVYERRSHPHIREKKVIGVVWSFYDITDRVELEKEIHESEQRFRGAFEFSSIGMSLVATNGRWLKVNKKLCEMLEYTEAELLSDTYKRVTYPDDLQATIDLTNDLLSGKKEYGELEKRYYSKSGKIIWVYINVTALKDENGKILYFVTLTRDITEEHNTRVVKDELNQKYELVTGISGQLFYEYTIDSGIIKWTGPIEKVIGYTNEEFQIVDINKWSDLIHPDDRSMVNKILDKAMNEIGHFNCEYRFRHKNGSYIHMYDEGLFFKDKDTKIVRMLGSMRDISLLKNAQAEVIRKENIFKNIVTNAPIVTFVLDKKGRFILSEGKGLNSLGLKPGQVVGLSALEFYKDFPLIVESINKSLKGETVTSEIKVGNLFFSTCFTPLEDANNIRNGVIGVATNITDLKKTQDIFLKASAQDEAILTAIPDGLIAIDNSDRIIFANPAAYEKLGIKDFKINNHLIGSILQLSTSSGQKLSQDQDPVHIARKLKRKVVKTINDNIYAAGINGVRFPVYISANPIFMDGAMIGIIKIFRDISIEKEIDRMKSEFVSLSSHQLRTPITSINWLTEGLLEDTNSLIPKHKKMVENIRLSNTRMTKLVDSLLNVARLEGGIFIVDSKPINLVNICRSTLEELNSLIEAKHISIKEQCNIHIKKYMADEHLLNIIIQNLISNAIKYSKEGGTITIKSELKDDFILFTFKDNGIGIPSNEQNKIFTKLFRASNAQTSCTDGTGLGLYIAKLIIDAIDGKIWFKSKLGIGTTFFIALPKSGMKKKSGTRSLV